MEESAWAVWHLEGRPDLGMEGRWQQSLGHIHWNLTTSFPCVGDEFQTHHSRGLTFFSSHDSVFKQADISILELSTLCGHIVSETVYVVKFENLKPRKRWFQ